MRQIQFFKSDFGDSPVSDFLRELPVKDRLKVTQILRWIEEIDMVSARFLKKLSGEENLWEVRVEWAGNAYRLLGFMHSQNSLVLVSAFQKKSQGLPKREIELARQRKKRYCQMNGYL